jgi:hypothetical protein
MRRRVLVVGSMLVAGVLTGCGGVEPNGETPESPVAEQNQSLAPSCPAGYSESYLWHCAPLGRYQPPCYYAGPGNYNVEHLWCQSGSSYIDAGPTGVYACGDCF